MQKQIFSKTTLGMAAAIVAATLVSQTPVANAATFGPNSYTQASDSPFFGIDFSEAGNYFYLEDFEDGSLNTPGVSLTSGSPNVLGSGPLTDSVDGDDGSIDGNGNNGRSLYSNGNNVLRFVFDASVLGRLPSHAGIVLTDIGFLNGANSGPLGGGNVTFRAFGASNQLLKTIISNNFGDEFANGGTSEDRFFGTRYYPGISAIEIEVSNSTDWEVDHLQYGYVPTPALLPGLIGMGVAALRKRRTEEEQAS